MDSGSITASLGREMEGEKSGVDMVSYCCEREREGERVGVCACACACACSCRVCVWLQCRRFCQLTE